VVAEEVMERIEAACAGPPAETYRRLYKVDSNGNLRVWFMELEGSKHRVVAGIEGGSLVENAWTQCVSKGKGKAQTTPEEQATKEVEALYRKALDRDYYETPEEARGPARNYLPMLAESWKATTWEKWTERVAKAGTEVAAGDSVAYFQPKLDGYCCIARASGLQSREGLPILTAPHVVEALAPFFAQYPEAVLHGELYNHALKDEFEKLGSLLKKQKGITDEHIAEVASKVQYHIYDFPGAGEENPFGVRSRLLRERLADVWAVDGPIQWVPTTPVKDVDHMLELTATALEDGYEGGIGRLHLPYEKAKRSWSVIKIKSFDDAEFEVVRIEEGKGNYAGYAKRVICWLPDTDRSPGPTKDNTFEAGIKGKRDQWLADLRYADHKIVTIRYFGYTQGGTGKPRMGVAIKWHGDRRVL
jgi:DNA ligase-1